jgi:hypothetical protein
MTGKAFDSCVSWSTYLIPLAVKFDDGSGVATSALLDLADL